MEEGENHIHKNINETELEEDDSNADTVIDFVKNIIKDKGIYSETLYIDPNGEFNSIREDGGPTFIRAFAASPENLFRLAKEIMEKYPDYKFDFQKDTEGKMIKYTISKK